MMLLLLACPSTATVRLDKDPADTANTDTANTDDTDGTDDTEVEPHAAAGSWEGTLDLLIVEAGFLFCTTDVELFVDDRGGLTSEFTCQPQAGPQGEPPALPFVLVGSIEDTDASGDVTVTVETPEGASEVTVAFSGTVTSTLDLTWAFEIPRGPESMAVLATLTAEKD